MIVYPPEWLSIGCEIKSEKIISALLEIVAALGVRNLSLSGGIDSTLLLWLMKTALGDPINCFTIACDQNHPDFQFSKFAAERFKVNHIIFESNWNIEPDQIVADFYENLQQAGVQEIIAGDGIDEFTCGYYSHLKDRSEQNYQSFIEKLGPEHLFPLNKNSGEIKVYLPYLSPDIVKFFSLIPLSKKTCGEQRKVVVREMAQDRVPQEIIDRWKYGFCDATHIKE